MKVKHISIRNFRGIKSLSWSVKGNFNCIIGSGDTGKTTILTALDFALSPRTSLTFDDSDFFDQDVNQDICIQVTLSDWNEDIPEVKAFFRESKFAQHKCGLTDAGPTAEPHEGELVAISVSLRVDKSLEPKWSLVKGPDEASSQERVPLYAADRTVLGLSRVDVFSDAQFTWARNTILTRLNSEEQGRLGAVLSSLARDLRKSDFSKHASIGACQATADSVKVEALKTGVNLSSLSPKLDLQRQSMTAGAISLHEGNVPLRNKGNGSKRLIAAAMQMKLHDGKSIALVDEIEMGLEPHRIRGLILQLKKAEQQLFTTTHSPVVIRELSVIENELYVCRRDTQGVVKVESLSIVPDIQGAVRANAEAFLGSKIVACEGLTEIGCLRAYDIYKIDDANPPVWTLALSYFNGGGGSKLKAPCLSLMTLGYRVAVFCDNDSKDQISPADGEALRLSGAHICQWDANTSTERQLFRDLPWGNLEEILELIARNHDSLELATIIDRIRKCPLVAELELDPKLTKWPESVLLRQVIGDLVNEGGWIKRIDYSTKVFRFALPKIPESSALKTKLAALWKWVQTNV